MRFQRGNGERRRAQKDQRIGGLFPFAGFDQLANFAPDQSRFSALMWLMYSLPLR